METNLKIDVPPSLINMIGEENFRTVLLVGAGVLAMVGLLATIRKMVPNTPNEGKTSFFGVMYGVVTVFIGLYGVIASLKLRDYEAGYKKAVSKIASFQAELTALSNYVTMQVKDQQTADTLLRHSFDRIGRSVDLDSPNAFPGGVLDLRQPNDFSFLNKPSDAGWVLFAKGVGEGIGEARAKSSELERRLEQQDGRIDGSAQVLASVNARVSTNEGVASQMAQRIVQSEQTTAHLTQLALETKRDLEKVKVDVAIIQSDLHPPAEVYSLKNSESLAVRNVFIQRRFDGGIEVFVNGRAVRETSANEFALDYADQSVTIRSEPQKDANATSVYFATSKKTTTRR